MEKVHKLYISNNFYIKVNAPVDQALEKMTEWWTSYSCARILQQRHWCFFLGISVKIPFTCINYLRAVGEFV